MSVLFKGMKMPENCKDCRIDGRECNLWQSEYLWKTERPSECPLQFVLPHGRLIDADALMKRIEHDTPTSSGFERDVRSYLETAPTIIEEEKE